MGEGMTRIARIILGFKAEMRGGILLVDDIDDGLHSALPDVWKVIAQAARDFDVQVFATTHSYECVSDAYKALGADGFVLHRLEAKGRKSLRPTRPRAQLSAQSGSSLSMADPAAIERPVQLLWRAETDSTFSARFKHLGR